MAKEINHFSAVVKSGALDADHKNGGGGAVSKRGQAADPRAWRGIAATAVRIVTGHRPDVMLGVYTRSRSLVESSAGAYFDDESAGATNDEREG